MAEGQDQLLRDLLIEPFTDEAVKRMGRRRPIKLSASELEAALSKSKEATTAWAFAELTRLQVSQLHPTSHQPGLWLVGELFVVLVLLNSKKSNVHFLF